jgi:hypothetical protein
MTNTTVAGVRGGQLPNLEAHGLAGKMKLAAALIKEQGELRRRKSELGHEQQGLREEIKRRERDHTLEWGRAMRSGEDVPADKGIEKAKRRLEEVGKEISAVSHAGDLSTTELLQVVEANREEWDAEVRARADTRLAEASEIADTLIRKLSETEGLVGVHTWLRSGGQSYSPASPVSLTPVSASIEQLLHERRRELDLLDMEVIG